MDPNARPESLSVVYIEDDLKLARLTARYLESHGVRVLLAGDAVEGAAAVMRTRPDVILLDLMLPGMDGIALCAELRQRLDTPIIMITARGEENDRVAGLESGADDYVTKPFSARELLARIRAQARRAQGKLGPTSTLLVVGALQLDPVARTAQLAGQRLELTSYEFGLLFALAERAGKILTRESLVDLVRGSAEEAFERSVDVHVSHLRRKLGDDPRSPRLLKTVRGVGYVLTVEDTSP